MRRGNNRLVGGMDRRPVVVKSERMLEITDATYTDIANPATDYSATAQLSLISDKNDMVNFGALRRMYFFWPRPVPLKKNSTMKLFVDCTTNLQAKFDEAGVERPYLKLSLASRMVTSFGGLTPSTLNWNSQGGVVLDAVLGAGGGTQILQSELNTAFPPSPMEWSVPYGINGRVQLFSYTRSIDPTILTYGMVFALKYEAAGYFLLANVLNSFGGLVASKATYLRNSIRALLVSDLIG